MDKCIIGVDAGGTKTQITAFTMDGQEIASGKYGVGSPAAIGNTALENIEKGLDDIYGKIQGRYEVSYIQMGISGLGVVREVSTLEKQLSAKYNAPVSMENDAVIALYSIIKNNYKQGILVLAGTGSSTLGVAEGKTMLVGGWGHLLGEKGSAFAVVQQATLNIISKTENKRDLSEFDKVFMKALNIEATSGFKQVFYQNTKDKVASYAHFINDMATTGDPDARQLLVDSGLWLASYVKSPFALLPFKGSVAIGFQGSFVCKALYVKETLLENLKRSGLDVTEVVSDSEPVVGAYYLVLSRLAC
jgi:N-acetylglucosamine kinase-like BadF-type ATPase